MTRNVFGLALLGGLSVSAAAVSSDACAQSMADVYHHSWRLELDESQQEVVTSGVTLLSPSLSHWGQVGIYFGDKDYEKVGASGRMDTIDNNEIAAVWRANNPIAPAFNMSTTIRAGKSSYKAANNNTKWQSHGFLEVQLIPTFEAIMTASWISRIDIGAGVGLRDNFIGDDQRVVGGVRIPSSVVYPELDIGLEI